jgi:hypothetical protein
LVFVLAGGLLGLIAALVPASSPADAHGDTIDFAVTGDGNGQVWAAATWADDHHRVDKRIAATITATSPSGQRVGPFPLTAVAGKVGVLTVAQPLPPGVWTVVAESAVPAIGRGEAVLRVGTAAGTPAPSVSLPAEPLPSGAESAHPSLPPSPSAAAAADTARGPGTWLASLLAIAAIAGLVAAVLLLRRRRT